MRPVSTPAANPKLVLVFLSEVTAIKARKMVTASGETLKNVMWEKPNSCTSETMQSNTRESKNFFVTRSVSEN
jgi:hypothetical protein